MSSKDKPKLAVITGAAEGIGQAYAERLATDGAEIVILDRLPGDKTLALIESVGSRGYYIKCDLANRGSIDAAAAEIHRRYGGCDFLSIMRQSARSARLTTSLFRCCEKC
jgi:NAD(P)-dependent dehydrogenase (short-subunit alcohol dehydrogenase family)